MSATKILKDLTQQERCDLGRAIEMGATVELRLPARDTRNLDVTGLRWITLCEFRVVPLKIEIPWDILAPEIKYVAMDADKTWQGYANLPALEAGGRTWRAAHYVVGGLVHTDGFDLIALATFNPAINSARDANRDWQETLYERP